MAATHQSWVRLPHSLPLSNSLITLSDDGKKYLIPANRITARSRMMVGGEKTKEFELSQQ